MAAALRASGRRPTNPVAALWRWAWGEVLQRVDTSTIVLTIVKSLIAGAKAVGVYQSLVNTLAQDLERVVPDALDADVAQTVADVAAAYAERLRSRG